MCCGAGRSRAVRGLVNRVAASQRRGGAMYAQIPGGASPAPAAPSAAPSIRPVIETDIASGRSQVVAAYAPAPRR